MKKLIYAAVVAVTVVLVLGSCGSAKNVAYFKNADSISLASSRGLYEARIMPKDELTITVVTTDPRASVPFNLAVSATMGTGGNLNSSAATLQGYLVDNNGDIQFPVVGKIHVAGLSKNECQDLVKAKIAPYLAEKENPIVTVRMSSYRVTVTGEVGRPGVVSVPTEKMSIVEALAAAGDLTIYGKRENVMLIREDATGQKTVHRLNLNDANIINSPYYYLQQNDIIYVEPNKVKAQNSAIGSSTSILLSVVGTLMSLGSIIISVVK